MSQQNKVENAMAGIDYNNPFQVDRPGLKQADGGFSIYQQTESGGYRTQTAVLDKKPETGGVKHDQGKPDFTYISYEFLEQMALVRDFGSKKYSRNNWKKGFKVTRSLAACLRHVFAFLRGEDNDRESGLSHLSHAACCLEHAMYDMINHPENDDRK